MRIKNHLLFLLAVMGLFLPAGLSAAKGPDDGRPARQTDPAINFRTNCDNAVRQYDMEVNNVRARLTTGGDIWFDGSDGRYVVPKPPPGQAEVSSIFAGAVWLGGIDPGGNLKVAAQDYGRSSGSFDYYPGPLTPEGTTSKDTCARWDKFFTVTGEDIIEFLALYEEAKETDNLPLNPDLIPRSILGWPGFGNPYFADIHGFELPDADQGLAGFWDENFLGFYDPTMGAYPIIEIRGCTQTPQFPEEMTFYIYNDAGNTHRQSGTPNQIQMEVQVQAFAYTSSDDLNNMTFQRYKLINRAQEDILNTYFAMWMDPDLGCSTDDYVGSDTVRSLAYVYNEDELDGANGCTCDQGVATYCDEVPILGVDYFRGPRGVFDGVEVELGMSSFMFFNRAGAGEWPPATTDPGTAEEYYSYLQGRWRDGTPLYSCGDGYDEACGTTRYAFPSAPDDENNDAWSMCSAELQMGDRRTLQASGPFTLSPGAVNELIVGVVWVPDQSYPCPSLRRLQTADDLAQSLFDNCFDKCDGPDAPDVDVVELDQEIILQLSNGRASNNFQELYEEPGLNIPLGEDSLYRFEGYRVYQFSGSNVSLADIGDPERVRQVAQFDLENDVTRVFNWVGLEGEDVNPLDPETYFVPELQVNGNDDGIRHTIRLTQDAFASGGDTRLINHRRYYYAVVAYGYNNYKEYDPFDQTDPGQRTQYKASSRNIGDRQTGDPFYTVIPRPILDRELFAEYGEGAVITRLAGEGNNGNFLDLSEETVEEVEAAFADNGSTVVPELTYQSGAGPIDVFVSNPRTIKDGEYEITIVDEDMDNDRLDDTVRWVLRSLTDGNTPTILSETVIDVNNEQIVPEFGFSVRISDVNDPGSLAARRANNGAIGASVTYEDPDADRWLTFIPDGLNLRTQFPGLDALVYDYVSTEQFERFEDEDPEQALTNLSPGIYPLHLMSWLEKSGNVPFLSPVWLASQMGGARRNMDLEDLRNVDIVFTDDKRLWTRTPVIETSNRSFAEDFFEGQEIKSEDDRRNWDLRDAPSVTREAGPDGLPAVDMTVEPDFEEGYGWFPGYAIDVETGERLNMIWGENSLYDGRSYGEYTADRNGNDMIWNPSSNIYDPLPDARPHIYNYVSGAQHYFYVMNTVYDEAAVAYRRLIPQSNPNSTRKVRAIQDVQWAGFPLLTPGTSLKSYADGIIPNDLTIKLRVNNSFAVNEGTEDTNGYPTYRFKFEGKEANLAADEAAGNRILDALNVVPNPYYGFSTYEDSQFENTVKITNLPARATVSIYTLDGKFIRKYNRDETPTMLRGADRPIGTRQISPALEWDLKNQAGIPVASGVYLIHVDIPGVGERTLKFFGVQRQFDPSGL